MTSIQEMYWLGYDSPQRAKSPRTSNHWRSLNNFVQGRHTRSQNVSAKIICRHPNYK